MSLMGASIANMIFMFCLHLVAKNVVSFLQKKLFFITARNFLHIFCVQANSSWAGSLKR